MKRRESHANGIYFKSNGKLLFLKGSYWDRFINQSAYNSLKSRLKIILETNLDKKESNGYKFVQDVEYRSLTETCNMIFGASCSDPSTWLDKETEKTLKDLS